MSGVWEYFEICDDDQSKAKCNLCLKKISRGGSTAKNMKSVHKTEIKPKESTKGDKPILSSYEQAKAKVSEYIAETKQSFDVSPLEYWKKNST